MFAVDAHTDRILGPKPPKYVRDLGTTSDRIGRCTCRRRSTRVLMQHQQPVRPLLDLPPRFTLGARAARHHPADRAAQNGRQRAMAARVPLKLERGQPHLTGGCSHATCQPARPLLDLPPRFTLGARAARHHPADRAAQNGRHAARNTRRKYVVGVCRMLPTHLSRASACTCE